MWTDRAATNSLSFAHRFATNWSTPIIKSTALRISSYGRFNPRADFLFRQFVSLETTVFMVMVMEAPETGPILFPSRKIYGRWDSDTTFSIFLGPSPLKTLG